MELGCGPGLVAIVASLLGTYARSDDRREKRYNTFIWIGAEQTVATDGDSGVVELAERNIAQNLTVTDAYCKCQAVQYLW